MNRTSHLYPLSRITEADIEGTLFPQVYERAIEYYLQRRVQRPQRIGPRLKALVRGTQLYTVEVEARRNELVLSCTCPAARTEVCKHIGAVLLQWIRDPDSFEVIEPASVEEADAGASGGAQPLHPEPVTTPSRVDAPPAIPREKSPESHLADLLTELPLTQLRDIARQRGWRVKGTDKGAVVTQLVRWMTDPTEIARGTTALPDELRKALRAAFIADDGSGVTPEAVAKVMTALRGPSRPAAKPVEAAGWLEDLKRWGLLVPLRDSAFELAETRHLLPWVVQRHIPPLPGWCPQRADPPASSTSVRVSDPRAALERLYAVWQLITQQEPALRATPPEQDRDVGFMVQGWPYDPEQVKAFESAKRGKSETNALTRPACPQPFWLSDDALSALAAATKAEPEELGFICRLLADLGLVVEKQGRAVGLRWAMTSFLRSPPAEQHRATAATYASMASWSELDLVLRRDPSLLLWYDFYPPFPYDQFRASLTRVRGFLLRILACAGEEGWCEASNLEAAVRPLWPKLGEGPIAETPRWLSGVWGVARRRPGEGLDTRRSADWRSAQGAFVRTLIQGPLYWLGLADLSLRDGELTAFRLHGLADCVWDRPVIALEEKPLGEPISVDEATGRIVVHPRAVSPQAHTLLSRLAALQQATATEFVYALDKPTAYGSFESGWSLVDILDEWKRVLPCPMPDAMKEELANWWQSYGQVRLYEGFALVELQDDLTLQELEASTSLRQHISGRLSPRLLLVPDPVVDDLLAELTAKGYTPKQVK